MKFLKSFNFKQLPFEIPYGYLYKSVNSNKMLAPKPISTSNLPTFVVSLDSRSNHAQPEHYHAYTFHKLM